jgi:hypothetical protein
MALALLGTVAVAVAQAPPSPTPGGAPAAPGLNQSTSPNQKVQLSATQKTAIYNAVSKDKSKSTSPANLPANFQASIGAKVPASIELHALPPEAVANAQAASSYRYAMINNQVVLVDPLTLQVVDIIRQ